MLLKHDMEMLMLIWIINLMMKMII